MLINFARAVAGASKTGAQAFFPMSFSTTYSIVHCTVAPTGTTTNDTGTWTKCINMTNSYVFFNAGWTGTNSAAFEPYLVEYIAFGF